VALFRVVKKNVLGYWTPCGFHRVSALLISGPAANYCRLDWFTEHTNTSHEGAAENLE
jgi:hypothetical protein